MKVLGIYGSPRKGGNSDLLLDRALDGAGREGAEVEAIYVRNLNISGCLECGGCDDTGECVLDDDMTRVYELMTGADAIITSAPIFFYSVPAQLKALIDRGQALWSGRMLAKTTPQARKGYDGGDGYLIGVGATKGKNLFEGPQLTAKYFYDALDMNYRGGLFYRGVEGKGAIEENPEALGEAFELGRSLVKD